MYLGFLSELNVWLDVLYVNKRGVFFLFARLILAVHAADFFLFLNLYFFKFQVGVYSTYTVQGAPNNFVLCTVQYVL